MRVDDLHENRRKHKSIRCKNKRCWLNDINKNRKFLDLSTKN